MKGFILGLGLISLVGCAGIRPSESGALTSVHYSAYFSLKLPTSMFDGAKVYSADGPALIFNGNKSLSGAIVTKELESLPDNFDLSKYPAYLFGLTEIAGLEANIQQRFRRSRQEMVHSLESPTISESKGADYSVFSACAGLECVSFIVQDTQSEQILMLSTNGFTPVELHNAIEGTSHANKPRER